MASSSIMKQLLSLYIISHAPMGVSLKPSMMKHGAESLPHALFISPPFFIERLLAQGLIGSFKSHAGLL